MRTYQPIFDLSRYRVKFELGGWPLFRRFKRPQRFDVRDLNEIDRTGIWIPLVELSQASQPRRPLNFCGKFEERNPFNIPGPFYGAMTDTCLTGPMEAPSNVLVDASGGEFVFRQPRLRQELQQILWAAYIDPFEGYGLDGNNYWTLQLIREWWSLREEWLKQSEFMDSQLTSVAYWRNYLTGNAKSDLREYAFYVESGRIPQPDDRLPEI